MGRQIVFMLGGPVELVLGVLGELELGGGVGMWWCRGGSICVTVSRMMVLDVMSYLSSFLCNVL